MIIVRAFELIFNLIISLIPDGLSSFIVMASNLLTPFGYARLVGGQGLVNFVHCVVFFFGAKLIIGSVQWVWERIPTN